jgi:hypothetical protein
MEVDPQPTSAPIPNRGSVLRAMPRRVLQPWTADLFARLAGSLAENASDAKANGMWRWSVRRILAHAETSGLTDARQITPAWLASFSPLGQDVRRERLDRSRLGRILAESDFWSHQDYVLFKQVLASSAARWNGGREGVKKSLSKKKPAQGWPK